jgi:hypothetical protein
MADRADMDRKREKEEGSCVRCEAHNYEGKPPCPDCEAGIPSGWSSTGGKIGSFPKGQPADKFLSAE